MYKNIILLAALITIAVVVLIVFNVYHSYTTSTISPDTSLHIVPITPRFDTNTIESLKRRKKIVVDFQEQPATESSNLQTENEINTLQSSSSAEENNNQNNP